jgi:hypothetical protein
MTMNSPDLPNGYLLEQELPNGSGQPQIQVVPGSNSGGPPCNGPSLKVLPGGLSDQQPVQLRLVPDKAASPLIQPPPPDRSTACEGSTLEILGALLQLQPGINLTEASREEVLAQAMQNAASTKEPPSELHVLQALCDVVELQALQADSEPPASAKDAQTLPALLASICQHIWVLDTLQKLGESYAQFAQRPIELDGVETTVGTLNWALQRQLACKLMKYEIDARATKRAKDYIASLDRQAVRVMAEAVNADPDAGRLYFEVVNRLIQQNHNDPERVTNEMITQALNQAEQETKQARQTGNDTTSVSARNADFEGISNSSLW